jgi:hypothetical protein
VLNKKIYGLCGSAVVALVAGTAQASVIKYTGVNADAGGIVTGAPVDKHDAFTSALTGVATEGFEGFDVGPVGSLVLDFRELTSPSTVTATAVLTTTKGAGEVVGGSTASARFNTTPTANASKWWSAYGSFTLDFTNAPISAFGLYATDVGDFGGRLTIDLLASNGDLVHDEVEVANSAGKNGSLLFWGFIDDAQSYTQITFGNTQFGQVGVTKDIFGFDDMTIGHVQPACTVNCGTVPDPVPGGSVPEPTSLALAGLGLFAAGLSFRQTRRLR